MFAHESTVCENDSLILITSHFGQIDINYLVADIADPSLAITSFVHRVAQKMAHFW